jgi:hypothetical protein
MQYVGKIFRYWIVAQAERIQVTLGCSINTCPNDDRAIVVNGKRNSFWVGVRGGNNLIIDWDLR